MVNNNLILIIMLLFIIQLLITVASFVLLIKLINTCSADKCIKEDENIPQNKFDIQNGVNEDGCAELGDEGLYPDAITMDGLDAFDELKHTENDPDRLLKILEFGLPDEEMEEIMKKLGKD